MLRVGVTGGIGSGKTMVCSIFSTLGIPVYNSDIRAKQIMTEHATVVEKLKFAFGSSVYTEEGTLNRKYLSDIVFNNKSKLETLNQIVHPAVYEDLIQWYAAHLDKSYVVQESALVFETGSYKLLDKTILVTADEDIRIARVMKRDHVSKEEVMVRIANQIPDSRKIELADYVIYNNEKESLIEQVMNIDTELKIIASRN